MSPMRSTELNIDSVKVRSLRPSPSTHLSSVDLCQVDPSTLCLFVSCSLVDLFVSSSMVQLMTALNDGSSMPMERSWRQPPNLLRLQWRGLLLIALVPLWSPLSRTLSSFARRLSLHQAWQGIADEWSHRPTNKHKETPADCLL